MEDLNDILAGGHVGEIDIYPRCVEAGCEEKAIWAPTSYHDPFWCDRHDPAKYKGNTP